MILLPEDVWARTPDSTGYLTLGCGTDNRGNTFLLDGLLTTKFPLGVVLTELSHQMRRRNAVLRASWVPRLQNEEADALTNSDFRHFDSAKRIPVTLEGLRFGVLDDLMREGLSYHDEVTLLRENENTTKEAAALSDTAGRTRPPRKRKKAGDALRDRQPR